MTYIGGRNPGGETDLFSENLREADSGSRHGEPDSHTEIVIGPPRLLAQTAEIFVMLTPSPQ